MNPLFEEYKKYEEPNKPYRLFRTFHREYGPNQTYPDYVLMPREGLRLLAHALLNDPTTGPIFKKAGIHGDIGAQEEPQISDFVEAYVREEGWERPDAAHLVAATVLARQLAEAAIPLDDVQAQLEFLEDKRCDGLDINPHGTREGRREHKEMKLSEILPFLQWIEGQEELKAPLTALRAKTFLRGQNFYEPDEKEVGDHFFMRIENFACRMAVHKYALSNRDLATIRNVVKTANHMYVENQADHYDSKNMIDQIKLYRAAQFIDDIDYDFAGAI